MARTATTTTTRASRVSPASAKSRFRLASAGLAVSAAEPGRETSTVLKRYRLSRFSTSSRLLAEHWEAHGVASVHPMRDGADQRLGEGARDLRSDRPHHDPADPSPRLVGRPLVGGDDPVDEGAEQRQRAEARHDALCHPDPVVNEGLQRAHAGRPPTANDWSWPPLRPPAIGRADAGILHR